jgi:hypothetical protein
MTLQEPENDAENRAFAEFGPQVGCETGRLAVLLLNLGH